MSEQKDKKPEAAGSMKIEMASATIKCQSAEEFQQGLRDFLDKAGQTAMREAK